MKKVIPSLLILFASIGFVKAQNNNANNNAQGASWKSNGNAAISSDFIGTTNMQNLVFKTNNYDRAYFDTQGNFIVKDRINPGLGGGEVIIGPGGLHRPVNQNPIAAFMLKVGGSGHFDGQVDMLKGIIEEYLWVKGVIKGPRIDVDSIKMDSTRGIYGHTKIFGDVSIKQNLSVDGSATFNGSLTAKQGLMFEGTSGIKLLQEVNGSKSFVYGNGSTLRPPPIPCAAGPQAWANHQFGGMLQIYDADPNGNYVSGSGLLNFQTWAGGSSIDASIGGTTATGGLLLNYFCGNNTYINTNNGLPNRGGKVFMGENVSMARYVGIGSNYPNENIDQTVALNVYANEANQTALKFNIWEGTVKAIDLVNPGNQFSAYTVTSSGKTQIKGESASAFEIYNPSNNNTLSYQVDGNGKTQIKGTVGSAFEIYNPSNSNLLSYQVDGNGKVQIKGASAEALQVFNPTNNSLSFSVSGNGKTLIGGTNPTISNNSSILEVNGSGSSFLVYGNAAGDIQSTTSLRPHFATGTDFTIYEGTPGSGYVKYQISNDKHLFNVDPNKTANAFEIFNTLDNKTTFRVKTNGSTEINTAPTALAFSVNGGATANSFMVYGGGNTEIRIQNPTANPNAFDIKDVNGISHFRVKANGVVYAREVQIQTSAFPDYVFANEYKLLTIEELDQFIKKNNHLPGFETAEYYVANGMNTSEILVKQQEKIEELTLYIIDLQKRLKAMEEKK